MDVDAAFVPVRCAGTSVPRLALAPDAGADWRAVAFIGTCAQHLPELCGELVDSTRW